jgi:flagellar basal body-associated protein FliL
MAKTTNPDETAEAAPGAPGPAKKSILGKLLVLVLVLCVVAVECVVAYLCIPSASSAAVPGTGAAKPPPDHKKGDAEPAGEGESDATVEIDLKEYSVTVFQAASNSTMRIDFHLFGIVDKEKENEFKGLLEKNQARLREQVVQTIRGAQLADLNDDPSLGMIKRTILGKAKTIFGRPLLKDLIISDFSSLEN